MPKLSAYEGVALEYGGNVVFLRPSLRAATHLERLHGGFPALLRKIEEFDTRTVRAAITYSADRDAAERLMAYAGTQPLSGFMLAAQRPLFELVQALLPEAPDDQHKDKSTGDPMPWAEVYRELFGLATGWLGWTPETAWSATPQEITDAFNAHLAKLKAIHGAGEDDDDQTPETYTPGQLAQIESQGHDPAFDRAGLQGLKAKGKA
ncbi:hypothetical protein [Roseovarius sp.]|uniref:hypothetical protein n=1 Tax=Roseovarius sp. TaxID=1486281 RepID=UPI002636C0FA|nr:hypothetical protein [Roseovarius sp.]MDM8166983.1 hypothetical protein [Roseovarius sp.]